MYLVAIAWIYVVLMMALAEALSSQGTLLGALFTLLLYGLLPLGVVLYIMGTPLRRRARLAEAQAQAQAQAPDLGAAAKPSGADAPAQVQSAARPAPSQAPLQAPSQAPLQAPDAGRVAPGDAVTSKGKEA